MKRLRVVTVVGTRPEIIRLSRVIAALDTQCEHVLVHTGQNYDFELSGVFFSELGIRAPDRFLEAAGTSSAETIGRVIIAVDRVLEELAPDVLLVLGDTNSCLAVIPAKRRKIPIFHMEAGNRCFDMRVPEEINRRIVDHTSDVNLTYSDIARQNLLAEGLPSDLVIKTGSPMFEVLDYYKPSIEKSDVLSRLDLSPRGYYVVSSHREENVDEPSRFLSLVEVLNGLADCKQLPVIVSTHPRTMKRVVDLKVGLHPLVRLLKPLGFPDYINLQQNATAVLSDSGTITEESSILNFPALNLRDTHERLEGMEEGAVMMTGLSFERILQCLSVLEGQPRGADRLLLPVSDYCVPNVSAKVVRLVHSYCDYVRRVTWKRF